MKKLDKPTAVLVFHVNKDHSEVGWDVYREMLEGGEFLTMLQAIRVPIELSVQAEDISFLATVNPAIVEEIRSNPKISVLHGPYTHTLPSFFPGTLQRQLALGKKVLEHHLKEKLSWVGSLPEVDVSTSIMPFLKKAGWGSVLVLEDLHYTYEYRKETDTRIPLTGKTILRFGKMPLIVAAGERLRDIYHKFYRGFATAEEFLSALKDKAAASKFNFVIFYIDFEIPQVNAINGNSRLDLWKEFCQALADSSMSFCHFQDPEVKRFIQSVSREMPETQIDSRPMPKWHHSAELYEKIEKALRNPSVDHHTLFRLTISDTFSALHYWPVCAELPVKNSDTKIVIKPDLKRRVGAVEYFLAKTYGKTPSLPHDSALRWYLENLEKAHQKESS